MLGKVEAAGNEAQSAAISTHDSYSEGRPEA